MTPQLTAGFAAQVFSSPDTPEGLEPTLQVLSVKKINAQNASATTADRYRIILSDGEFYCQAMLATQLNGMVDSKELDKNAVVKLTGFVTNQVQGRKLIIILSIEVIPYSGEKIGSPANIETALNNGNAPAAATSASVTNGKPANGVTAGRAPATKAPTRVPGGKDVGPLYPIEGLSPYQNKWTIKARVTAKSEIKHWTNQRGEGKLFNVTFMDETGEIRATGFNDQVDNFYPLLEEGKVYFVSRARVNLAKKQFSNVNNDYEIGFDRDTEITPCDDDSVPSVKYNFTRIDELENLAKDEMCDVVGVVREVHDLGSVTSKATNKPFAKRDIQLVDQSGKAVRLTLWGKQAETFSYDDNPVIAFKGVKVGDFGGRSLSMFSSATMSVNPEINEAHALRGWYDTNGKESNFTSYTSMNTTTRADGAGQPTKLSDVKTLGEIKDESLGMNDKPDFFTTSAVIGFIRQESFAYPACANPDGCNKKVTEDTDGKWRCEKCEQSYVDPIYRYILSMNVMDHTSSIWVTAFNDTAEKIIGISANDIQRMKNDGNDTEANNHFVKATGKSWTFDMMAKQDQYQDQSRIRYTVRKANTPDYAAESQWLSQQIALIDI